MSTLLKVFAFAVAVIRTVQDEAPVADERKTCLPLPLASQRLGYQYAADLRLNDDFVDIVKQHAERVSFYDAVLRRDPQTMKERYAAELENEVDRYNFDQLRDQCTRACALVAESVLDACTSVHFDAFVHCCRLEIVVTAACLRRRTPHRARYDERVRSLVRKRASGSEPAACDDAALDRLFDRVLADADVDESFAEFQERMSSLQA